MLDQTDMELLGMLIVMNGGICVDVCVCVCVCVCGVGIRDLLVSEFRCCRFSCKSFEFSISFNLQL